MAQSHGVLIASSGGSNLQSPRPDGQQLQLDLLKNFPFASGPGLPFFTDWVSVDSQSQNAQVHVHCQTLAPAGLLMGVTLRVESSFDTVESYAVTPTISIPVVGSQSIPITSNLGPMVRLVVDVTEPVTVYAILSVWLQPKS